MRLISSAPFRWTSTATEPRCLCLCAAAAGIRMAPKWHLTASPAWAGRRPRGRYCARTAAGSDALSVAVSPVRRRGRHLVPWTSVGSGRSSLNPSWLQKEFPEPQLAPGGVPWTSVGSGRSSLNPIWLQKEFPEPQLAPEGVPWTPVGSRRSSLNLSRLREKIPEPQSAPGEDPRQTKLGISGPITWQHFARQLFEKETLFFEWLVTRYFMFQFYFSTCSFPDVTQTTYDISDSILIRYYWCTLQSIKNGCQFSYNIL